MQVAMMNGQALDVEDNSFDAAFSIFGLMVFPDALQDFVNSTAPFDLEVVRL